MIKKYGVLQYNIYYDSFKPWTWTWTSYKDGITNIKYDLHDKYEHVYIVYTR